MIEIILNDRFGHKIRLKCNSDDTIWDVKRVLALQLGTQPERLSLMRGTSVLKDPVQLQDYEISDSTSLELAYA